MNVETLHLGICTGMVMAGRHWRRTCQMTLASYGITEARAAPLMMIHRLGDGVRQVTVAHASGLESPSLVRLLDQLCAEGLVVRTEDLTDRRAKTLRLTPAGNDLAESIEKELIRLRKVVLGNVSQADLEAALRVVRAFEESGYGTTAWPS